MQKARGPSRCHIENSVLFHQFTLFMWHHPLLSADNEHVLPFSSFGLVHCRQRQTFGRLPTMCALPQIRDEFGNRSFSRSHLDYVVQVLDRIRITCSRISIKIEQIMLIDQF